MSQAHAVPFVKYHGTGNDFLVVDADEYVPDRAAFARTHCDRETGVAADEFGGYRDGRAGADGVLFLHVEAAYSPSRVVMTLVQPDGSTAAMCGNGARVVARWAHERTGETAFMIDTQAGTRHATVADDGQWVDIEMGEPRVAPAAVPLARAGPAARDEPLIEEEIEGLTVTAVNTGVPHAVAFVDDVDAYDLDAVAEPVRHADAFPEGANVNLAAPVDPDELGDDTPTFDQRTFERGVEGETRSCGTGGVAVAAAAKRLGLFDGETARTRPPGGELEITVPDDGPATLSGPVTREFSGELPVDPR